MEKNKNSVSRGLNVFYMGALLVMIAVGLGVLWGLPPTHADGNVPPSICVSLTTVFIVVFVLGASQTLSGLISLEKVRKWLRSSKEN